MSALRLPMTLALAICISGCTGATPETPSPDAFVAMQAELTGVREELRTMSARVDSIETNASSRQNVGRQGQPRATVPRASSIRRFSQPSYTAPTFTSPVAQQVRTLANIGLIRGPRGGCYYISGSGRKKYVERSWCN